MPVRRIVVAVDASPTSVAALEATTELAAAWGAEVLGIFVEDVNLLKAASLPFAREVGSHSGAFRRVDPDGVRRQLHFQAERARGTLIRAATNHRVTVSFRVARGRVNEELLAALSEADLLSLGKGGRTIAARLGLGSTARAIASSANGHVLLLSHVSRVTGPIAVVHDGSPAADLALNTAGGLAGRIKTHTIALCLAETREASSELALRVDATASAAGFNTRCRHCTRMDARDLARLARSFGANMMVVPVRGSVLPDRVVEGIVGDFFGPVLLVAQRS